MNPTQNWQRCNAHTFWKEEATCAHVVQIYENEQEFLHLLENFVSSGFAAGEAVILITTSSRLSALQQSLKAHALDLDALKASDQFITLDAEEVLTRFMVNEWPNYSLFMETFSEVFARARKENRKIRAYGEMVAILWERGNSGATMMLEQLWNMYCEKEPFTLFCAYPGKAFTLEPAVSVQNICKTHTKMIAGSNSFGSEITYQNVN